MYTAVKELYPNHSLAKDATDGLVRVSIVAAKHSDTGTVPQPKESGSAQLGTTVYIPQNDSPYRIQIMMQGPETTFIELPVCDTCQKLSEPPDSCTDYGPNERVMLKPGKYEVLVKAIDTTDDVTPYTGSWELKSGEEYSDCYYVQTRHR
jgi:hypothetical protein